MNALVPIAIALASWLGPPAAPPAGGPSAPVGAAQPTAEPASGESAIAVTTRLDPDPSTIGDLLRYQVVVGYPREYSVNLPSVIDLSPLHLVSVQESEPEATGDGLRKTFTLQLQRFDIGEASVPSFSLTYVEPDGEVQTRQVPPHPFVVESLLANEADPQRRGEDPPISIEYPNTLAETIIWSTLGTLLALVVLIPLARRLWGRRREAPAPPPIPPHEVAYQALHELEQGDLLADKRYTEYYLHLTEIAKGYLEGRFGIPALDRTTEEIRRTLMLRGESIAPLSSDEVVSFLQSCDLVKFARFTPGDDEATEALSSVRTMVDRTVPVAAKPKPASSDAEPGPPDDGADAPPSSVIQEPSSEEERA